jgi:hypothetical protein
MESSIKKILRIISIALVCLLLLPFLITVVISLTRPIFESPNCRQFGYERMDYISSGAKTDVKVLPGARLEFPNESHLFPIHNDLLPAGKGLYEDGELVDIRDLTSLVQCEDLKYAERIRVVRFKVKEPKIFTDSRIDYQSKNEFISGGMVPWDLYQEYRANGRAYGHKWLTKPDPLTPTYKERNRKDHLDKLKIDWLKDEPLGGSEFVGLWRGGWLFRSKYPDQYVWID